MSENSENLVRKIASDLAGKLPEEQQANAILLGRQVSGGRQMEFSITLREQDIPQDHPELKIWMGSQFIRFKDGGWTGEPGNLGPQTFLGKVLESTLSAQLKKDEARQKSKGEFVNQLLGGQPDNLT